MSYDSGRSWASRLQKRMVGTMNLQATVINELQDARSSGSAHRRAEVLWKITDMFVENELRYSDEQIRLFDKVLSELANEIERFARAELSNRLCTAATPLPTLLRQLAFDEAIEVAAPLLMSSDHLDDALLVECAHTQSQGHLLAISQRRGVSEAVTDALVIRGEAQVLQAVVDNPSSRFSNKCYATLVRRAAGSDTLTVGIGSRVDLPRHHFLRLLAAASTVVREKLEAASPQNAADIRSVVSQVTKSIAARTANHLKDYGAALEKVRILDAAGELTELQILRFIADRKCELAVAAVAVLAKIDVSEIEQAMMLERAETLLIVIKSIGLGWPTAKALLQLRAGNNAMPRKELEQALSNFERINRETAQQALAIQRRQDSSSGRGLRATRELAS